MGLRPGKRELGATHKGHSPIMLNRSLWAITRQNPRRLTAVSRVAANALQARVASILGAAGSP